jgi:hypothetical protein
MVDYYRLFKGRTSNIFGLKVDKKIIDEIFEKSKYSDNILHNYAIVQYGYYQDKVIYQLIIYSKENKKPEIIWFNDDLSFFS